MQCYRIEDNPNPSWKPLQDIRSCAQKIPFRATRPVHQNFQSQHGPQTQQTEFLHKPTHLLHWQKMDPFWSGSMSMENYCRDQVKEGSLSLLCDAISLRFFSFSSNSLQNSNFCSTLKNQSKYFMAHHTPWLIFQLFAVTLYSGFFFFLFFLAVVESWLF